MFHTLKVKLGLSNQEQAVNSIELAENEVQLWDEMDDETASVYGGGRSRVSFRYDARTVAQKPGAVSRIRKRITKRAEATFRQLPEARFSTSYIANISKKKKKKLSNIKPVRSRSGVVRKLTR